MENNPYAPTKAALNETGGVDDGMESGSGMRVATRGRRLTNLMIDDIVYYVLMAVIVVPIAMVGGIERMAEFYAALPFVAQWLLLSVVRLGYYYVCEATTGRTVGKLVSGTRVVSESGGKPTNLQILQRTLSRVVPFEPFSFFGSAPGWHDRWSKTRVILTR
ncbi:MAG TPA: RDD family protein [Steroidobacteraceae bacterium]